MRYKKNFFIYIILEKKNMASPMLLSRLSVLEAKLAGTTRENSSLSEDKLKPLILENKELKKKVDTLEQLIKEVSKKADDFSKITNENTKNIANNLKTLQDGLAKVEIATKVDSVSETSTKGKKN
jgi:uncharacterized protein YlxW (UPF0749 family)